MGSLTVKARSCGVRAAAVVAYRLRETLFENMLQEYNFQDVYFISE
jgi:hypothetical protein